MQATIVSTLKRETAEVSSGRSPMGFPTGRRPARTPPSTFLFLPIHLSNNSGPGSRPSGTRRAAEAPAPDRNRGLGPREDAFLRSFAGAPEHRSEPRTVNRLYRPRARALSTHRKLVMPYFLRHLGCAARMQHMALDSGNTRLSTPLRRTRATFLRRAYASGVRRTGVTRRACSIDKTEETARHRAAVRGGKNRAVEWCRKLSRRTRRVERRGQHFGPQQSARIRSLAGRARTDRSR